MKYDFSQKYVIKIKGKTAEIKEWIKELSNAVDNGGSYKALKDDIDSLETITELRDYSFGQYHKIFFNHNTLTYIPNVHEESTKELYFNIFKSKFDEAKKVMDKKYKPGKLSGGRRPNKF
jgi:hypothetical protein